MAMDSISLAAKRECSYSNYSARLEHCLNLSTEIASSDTNTRVFKRKHLCTHEHYMMK